MLNIYSSSVSTSSALLYASKIACDLIDKKLIDRNISYSNLQEFNQDSIMKYKHFEVSFNKDI